MEISDKDKKYEKKCEELENKLKPKLTDEFLDTLAQAVKTCGWTVDHIESTSFVKWCFNLAGKEKLNLEPYLIP